MSNIIKNNADLKADGYFEEDVFYPRLHNKEKELKHIRQAAEEEALRIIQEAETQAGEILKRFEAEGIRRGLEKVSPLESLLRSLLDEMARFSEQAVSEMEPIVVEFALKIARKVIKDEVRSNPDVIKQNVREALDSLMDKKRVTLFVHPDDWEVLQSYQETLLRSFSHVEGLEIKTNKTLSRGGCYVKTERGDVDATVETQFNEVAKSLGRQDEF